MLSVRNLKKVYRSGISSEKSVIALHNVSFDIHQGEVFGIVGESGSGKTTLARILLRLVLPDEGSVFLEGRDVLALKGRRLRIFRKEMQAVTQTYETALNPRMKVKESLKEVFLVKGRKSFTKITTSKLAEMLAEVGLGKEHLDRYPSQLSGGELQRVIIARVMALTPGLIIADEPTSNLDVSTQAQIIHLMLKLKEKIGSTLIIISHDLELVSAICDRVAVLKNGRIEAIGPVSILSNYL